MTEGNALVPIIPYIGTFRTIALHKEIDFESSSE